MYDKSISALSLSTTQTRHVISPTHYMHELNAIHTRSQVDTLLLNIDALYIELNCW